MEQERCVTPLPGKVIARIMPSSEEYDGLVVAGPSVQTRARLAQIVSVGSGCTLEPGQTIIIGKSFGGEELVDEMLILSEGDIEAVYIK